MPKTLKAKPLYSPPRLTVVGSIEGLTERATELAWEDRDSACFDLSCDRPERCSIPVVLH